jgi:DGQHR domain-containing protein
MKRSEICRLPATVVIQPIGTFYVTAMDSELISTIAVADVRRLNESQTEIEEYLGIQRKLDSKRRIDIAKYVRTIDATFPTSVVVAVEDERCIDFERESNHLLLFEVHDDVDGPAVAKGDIAKILDGQHRLAGLRDAGVNFTLPVTIFQGIDVADQAYIFATVNIAQTKVNSSLAYDLLAYSRSRSPERSCHDITVALNSGSGSPLEQKIKRLGSATPGVIGETLTQATVVKALLPYLSRDPKEDRENLRRGKPLLPVTQNDLQSTPFRNYFVTEQDRCIADLLWEYFSSIRAKWTRAWEDESKGQIIKRTNGFRSFMNVLRGAYFALGGDGTFYPKSPDYAPIWECSTLGDSDFTSDKFLPGTSGESALTKALASAVSVFRTRNAGRPVKRESEGE